MNAAKMHELEMIWKGVCVGRGGGGLFLITFLALPHLKCGMIQVEFWLRLATPHPILAYCVCSVCVWERDREPLDIQHKFC